MASVDSGVQQPAREISTPRPSGPRDEQAVDVGGLDALDTLDRRLLDDFQQDVPICPRPYAAMAERVGSDEETVIARLALLEKRGYLSRVGPVFRPGALGASTLAAMAVPADRLQAVADTVSGYTEVNHNYEREHEFNLWFVVTAKDEQAVAGVLEDVRRRTGLAVMDLPLLEEFHIDLGFPLWRT
jgi:DNA-binding Lrp family transcriptional regulator